MPDLRRTIPRSRDLDSLNPEQAATAVSSFLGAPQRSGPWSIEKFVVDEASASRRLFQDQLSGNRSYVPPGDYLMLQHDRLDRSISPEGTRGTMMSNTPDEVTDHAPVFTHAEGDVLIHGLGLSCVVSGLLTKPEVRHIDVVDIDADVIAMVAPAYEYEPRVTIHHDNAIAKEWAPERRWNYVWHDIWATISSDNLDPKEAENGLSYGMFFDRFADRCDRQDAWAYRLAKVHAEAERMRDEFAEEWIEQWRGASRDARLEMIFKFHAMHAEVQGLNPEAMRLLADHDEKVMANYEEATESENPAFDWDSRIWKEEAKEVHPEDPTEEESRVRLLFDR